MAVQQIRDYLNPPQPVKELEKRGGKPVPQMEAADMERRRKQMMER